MNIKKLLFLALTTISVVLTSCNDKIELTGDFKETAVIYGLLNQADSVQYIKITRAFIGPGNALEISKIPDSNYFASVNATVSEYINGVLQRSWTLTDTTITNKSEDGAFYGPEQKLYCFYTPSSSPLNIKATYKLNIDINNGQFTVNGETELISELSIGSTASFKFSDKIGSYKTQSISVGTGNSGVVNTKLRVNYYEFTGGDSTLRSFYWNLGDLEVNPEESKTFGAEGSAFYSNVKASCDAFGTPGVIKRKLESIDIISTGGTEELFKYIEVNQPSSSLSQSKPTFTNLTVTNDYRVVGIFSARQTLIVHKPFKEDPNIPGFQSVRCIDKNSTKELCEGPISGLYLFCSDHTIDIAQGESFTCN